VKQVGALAILVFDAVELLFCGLFEVFSVAGRLTDPLAFSVLPVAVSASAGSGEG
jgi:hypothetical protein